MLNYKFIYFASTVLGLGLGFVWYLCYFLLSCSYSTAMLFTYSESSVSERPVSAQSLQVQIMFVMSIDVVVYYLIRNSSLNDTTSMLQKSLLDKI